jgi:hypothetical protein
MANEAGGGGGAGLLQQLLERLRNLLGDLYQDVNSDRDEAIFNLMRYFVVTGGRESGERNEELISLARQVGGPVARTSGALWLGGLEGAEVQMDGLNGQTISLSELLRNTQQDISDDDIQRISGPTVNRPDLSASDPNNVAQGVQQGATLSLGTPTNTSPAVGANTGGDISQGTTGTGGAGGGPLATIGGGPDLVVDNLGKFFIINPATQTRYEVGGVGSGSYNAAVALFGGPRNVNTALTGWNRGGSAVDFYGGPNMMEKVVAGLIPDPFTGNIVGTPQPITTGSGEQITPAGWRPELNGVPQGAEIWKVGNAVILAYKVDGGPYVYYNIPDPATRDRIFANIPNPEIKVMTQAEVNRLGAVKIGSTNLLSDPRITGALGFGWQDGFESTLDREALTSPWLKDSEVVATILAATLEGREVTTADLESTTYFASRSDAEISYVAFSATATTGELKQYHLQFEDLIRDQLEAAGMRSPDPTVVGFMARKMATGEWTESYAARQIVGLSNPFSSVKIDTDLATFTQDMSFDTLRGQSEQVRQLVEQWLGPLHSRGFSDEWYQQWAGAVMDDPNAENDLKDYLQGQRLALYPEYTNPNLRYSDIAPVWENALRTQWGRVAASDSDLRLVDQLIRLNDSAEAGKVLRKEGLNQGVGQVQQEAMSGMFNAFGTGVVNSMN